MRILRSMVAARLMAYGAWFMVALFTLGLVGTYLPPLLIGLIETHKQSLDIHPSTTFPQDYVVPNDNGNH